MLILKMGGSRMRAKRVRTLGVGAIRVVVAGRDGDAVCLLPLLLLLLLADAQSQLAQRSRQRITITLNPSKEQLTLVDAAGRRRRPQRVGLVRTLGVAVWMVVARRDGNAVCLLPLLLLLLADAQRELVQRGRRQVLGREGGRLLAAVAVKHAEQVQAGAACWVRAAAAACLGPVIQDGAHHA